jgi:hypothetical protein
MLDSVAGRVVPSGFEFEPKMVPNMIKNIDNKRIIIN